MNRFARIDCERRRLTLPDSGVSIALLDWGGDGPLALLHHANGFCAALWAPVAECLREHFHVVAMDARGHGDSSLPPAGATVEAFEWPTLCEDLLGVAAALLAESGESRIALGLGHSFGGTLTLAAAARRPDLYERLVLVDPVIVSQSGSDVAERSRGTGLVERSRRRRHDWPSRSAARKHFASRELFANWQPRALELYLAEGLRERADGSVELKCPGAVEASVFEGGLAMDTFTVGLDVVTPTQFLWAERGNFPRETYERLASKMADAHIVDADAGHLIPMEQPELVVEAVLRGLDPAKA